MVDIQKKEAFYYLFCEWRGVVGLDEAWQNVVATLSENGCIDTNNFIACRQLLDSFRDTPAEEVRMRIGVILPEVAEIIPENFTIEKIPAHTAFTARKTLAVVDMGAFWKECFAGFSSRKLQRSALPTYEWIYSASGTTLDVQLHVPLRDTNTDTSTSKSTL